MIHEKLPAVKGVFWRYRWAVPMLVGLGWLLAGCSGIGPRTVARDRFDYSNSIAESWKRQMLLNIVKLRYFDPPLTVDVGQIVAGYSLETDVSVGGTLEHGSDSLALGAGARYTDRPTITYTPLTGARLIRSSLMPLPPDAVFFTIQAGWAADGVLAASVASINGIKNQEGSIAGVAPPDPEFLRVMELFRKIQQSGAVAIRVEQDAQKKTTTIMGFRSANVTPETLVEIEELRRLLRLAPDAHEFKLVFAATPANDREIAVVTRSMVQIMGMIAAHVQVPEKDVAEGRAIPGFGAAATLRIGSSATRPTDCFVTVAYRGRWFWVDDRDLRTKRAFSLLMMLGSLAETGDHGPPPLITIPAQ